MEINELNDFPVLSAATDAFELYDSFLQCEKLVRNIPGKILGVDRDFAFFKMLKEVHEARSCKQTLFRKRDDANDALLLLWLSRVKELAKIYGGLNEVPPFKGLNTTQLREFAQLSVDIGNINRLDQILLEHGILVVFEPSIPGMKLDGAVFNLATGNPVVGLSLRYARLDNFWFTLMHELAHISKHYEMLVTPILDDLENEDEDLVELAANRVASNALISRSDWRSCQALYSLEEADVISFASKVGVHPAIVAGRIRKDLNRHELFSRIVNEVNVREILFGNE
ncbi:MAG: hypothetical protein CVU32_01700 [Betaproteobacteria bacterium HGW-Betaproteobacteria-5]|jgi:HTH-type transcriptional regulator/antitoxin HigA|nr:MAG: hypothetical protein CVU32_01700 [Betaproteobacteria bacterium HGW-Betaproteobacteria-5]PKO40491.1 MAG: hypothetical protein CVU33_02300 [Betaproteobacteria bacterium HGW-Betaproteobacteria-6]